MIEQGIIYVATGQKYVEEAILSVKSLRQQMPDIYVILHTDIPDCVSKDLFNEIKLIEKPTHSFLDKISPLVASPFKKTVFLDTDTYIAGAFYDIFELLERFDLAAAHAPMRSDAPFVTPNVFAELNTGVIAYRMSDSVRTCFLRWRELYSEQIIRQGNLGHDQPGLRQALWEMGIRVYILPSEYNLRTVMPGCAGKQRVRIIHGRARDMKRLVAEVNGSRDIRVFLPDWHQCDSANLRVLSDVGNFWIRIIQFFVVCAKYAEKILKPIKKRLIKGK